MDVQVDCMVDGADMVWEYVLEFCSSVEFSSGVWADSYDHFRGVVEYFAAHECVKSSFSLEQVLTSFSVLISILSNTVARIDAVRCLILH
jgi:hypothetical protein